MDTLLFVILGIALTTALVWSRSRYADFLSQRPEHYDTQQGTLFDLRKHLNGRILCDGVIYGPLGRVSSSFVGEFNCHWDGNTGRMEEVFRYDDGSQQQRAWNLVLEANGRILATADDVVGDGHGVQYGNAVQLVYRYKLPDASGGHVMDVVDWMYLTPNGTIVNRSQFRKFGIKMAELVATMRQMPDEVKKAA